LGLVLWLLVPGIGWHAGRSSDLDDGFGVAITPTATAAPIDAGWDDTSVTFQGERHEVLIYRPAGYPDAAPYPVVYLLHGHGESPASWRRPDVEQQADTYRVLVVAVEGDNPAIMPSWYSRQTQLPWPAGADWRVAFYDWFFAGAVPWVEATYPTRRDAGGRAIAGFSMGGKGAVSLAGHRPDLFCAVASFGGVMDLRDYSTALPEIDVARVYGPLDQYAIRYAADSPVELAPNLKGLNLTILHGAEDTLIDKQQSRKMHQALNDLGYAHVWQELPGLGHEVSAAEIALAFARFAASFQAPYHPPVAWRYRFADARSRQIYDTTLTKTDPLTWTEVLDMTPQGLTGFSGDAFQITTPPWYTPLASYQIALTGRSGAAAPPRIVLADGQGRLTMALPAGRWQVSIAPQPATPTPAALPAPTDAPMPRAVTGPAATSAPAAPTSQAEMSATLGSGGELQRRLLWGLVACGSLVLIGLMLLARSRSL
jgi:S-formylglutathione hydrolase FrmB